MANIIDILPQTKTTSTETSTSSEKESVKDKPSLFDSLLQNSVKVEKKSEEKVESKIVSKEEKTSNKDEINKKVDNAKEVKDTKEEKVETKTTSLLDRLIFEAKNEVTGNSEIKNNSLLDTKISEENTQTDASIDKLVLENKTDAISESTEKETASNLNQNISETKNNEVKSENKENPNLVLETKDKNVKEIVVDSSLKEELLNSETVKNDKKDVILVEEAKDKNVKEIVVDSSLKEELLNSETVKDNSIENIIVTENSENDVKVPVNTGVEKVIAKEEVKKENKVIKINDENLLVEKSITEIKTNDKINLEKVDVKIVKEVANSNETVNVEEQAIITNNSDLVSESSKNILAESNIENILSTTVEEVDIKNVIEPEKTTQKKKTLMDLLIEKNMKNVTNVFNDGIDAVKQEGSSKDFISNMYLSEQKNLLNNQFLFNKNEALNLLKDGASLNDIEKSANILELGFDNIDVEQSMEVENLGTAKKQDFDLSSKKNILDSLLNEKNIRSDDIKNLITKSVEASSALLDNTLNVSDDTVVNVNSPIAYNIQSKIIGAKQQMATMMSDIARQMYENYKPPVTVFRINLNPLELGSIAIMMKNDKNNALTISMNVSNNTTLDALVDNQNVLKNSLNKTFDDNTRFNLDFSSSNQNNNQSSNNQNNQSSQYQDRRFEKMDTQSVLQLTEENKDRDEKLDYM